MRVKSQCKKCGETILLDFGEMGREEAVAIKERLDTEAGECPGGHVELGGLGKMWQVEEAIHRGFDLGEIEPEVDTPTDEAFVQELLAKGKVVLDGGQNTVPSLGLDSIHKQHGLRHVGFGNFANDQHVFVRTQSPKGTRFYERLPAE